MISYETARARALAETDMQEFVRRSKMVQESAFSQQRRCEDNRNCGQGQGWMRQQAWICKRAARNGGEAKC